MITSRFSKVLALVLSVGIASCDRPVENVSVPARVLQAFNATHPNITPQWNRRIYGYEAVFTQNGIEYEVEYSSNGVWLETEYEVQRAQFPPAVLQAVSQQYPAYTITKYEIELTPQGTFYELEIARGGIEREIYFNARGQRASNFNEDG